VAGTSSPDKQLPSSAPQQPSIGQALSYQDIVNNVDEDDDEDLIYNNKPKWQGRGGRKNKNKKNKKEEYDEVDWDAIYDPAKPSNLARYQGSTEQDSERAEWTHFLHCQKTLAQKHSKFSKPQARNSASTQSRGRRPSTDHDLDMFAPPSNLSFAPPAFDYAPHPSADPMDIDDDEYHPPPAAVSPPTFNATQSSFATSDQNPTGDDAYMRRLRMSGMSQPQAHTDFNPQLQQSSLPVASSTPPASIPPTVAAVPSVDMAAKKADALAKIAAFKAKINAQHAQNGKSVEPASTPPQNAMALPTPPPPVSQADTSTIIKAPVRYNLADAQVDTLLDREDARAQSGSISTSQSPAPVLEQARSRMPGQKGFGARMMAKMGWEEGQGLGAKGEGITTAIIAQPSKRKRRSDKDGGGWAQQPNMGKIVGGKKAKAQTTDEDLGQFGLMSYVVKLQGMLDELDVAHEIEENNLMQEIGEEFSKSFGEIERVFVWREENGGDNAVFVKFTSQLSALNACTGRDGMTFAGNAVAARFFPTDKFEAGEYA
jgi:splicing factor 45